MGYQNIIAITGIATTADNKSSNGTVDGVDSFDTKKFAPVDPATQTSIGEVDNASNPFNHNPNNSHNIAGLLSGNIKNYFDEYFTYNSLNRKQFEEGEGKRLHLIG